MTKLAGIALGIALFGLGCGDDKGTAGTGGGAGTGGAGMGGGMAGMGMAGMGMAGMGGMGTAGRGGAGMGGMMGGGGMGGGGMGGMGMLCPAEQGPQDCMRFCAVAAANCTGANMAFADNATCMTTCAGFATTGMPGDTGGNTLQCRIYHACATPASVHCTHIGMVSPTCTGMGGG
jgi:hypothetical protein